MAEDVATHHHLSVHQFLATIDWENPAWDCTAQSNDRNAKDGGRELSFGLAMIHLPDHPDVSHAEATDCAFSLEWMAQQWERGGQRQWTGWRVQFGN